METFQILNLFQDKETTSDIPKFMYLVSTNIDKEAIKYDECRILDNLFDQVKDHKIKSKTLPALELEAMMITYTKLENIHVLGNLIDIALKASFLPSTETLITGITFLAKNNNLPLLQKLFNLFAESELSKLSSLQYLSFASAFAEIGSIDSTRTTYNTMVQRLSSKKIYSVNLEMFSQVLKVYMINGVEEKALEFMQRIRKENGGFLGISTYNRMLEAYIKMGDTKQGLELVDMIMKDSVGNTEAIPDVEAFLNMAELYSLDKNPEKTLEMLEMMSKYNMFLPKIWNYVIDAHASSARSADCLQLLTKELTLQQREVSADNLVYFMKVLMKSQDVELAERVLDLIYNKADGCSERPVIFEQRITLELLKKNFSQANLLTHTLVIKNGVIPSANFIETWFNLFENHQIQQDIGFALIDGYSKHGNQVPQSFLQQIQ